MTGRFAAFAFMITYAVTNILEGRNDDAIVAFAPMAPRTNASFVLDLPWSQIGLLRMRDPVGDDLND
jgi:hypothetical protein